MRAKAQFEIYRCINGEWRWRVRARNKKILADSGEGYKRYSGALKSALRLVLYCGAPMPIVKL
jgi:uncharacterized protein YegP (UPF0339 family)